MFFKTEITRFTCYTEGGTTEYVKNHTNYNVLVLDKNQKRFGPRDCNWHISKPGSGSFLNLVSAVLDSDDSLTITGIRVDDSNSFVWNFQRTKHTLFQTKGSFSQKGLVYLSGYSSITVNLNLKENALSNDDLENSDPRSFYAVYHSSVVELQQNTGQLTFFLNTDPKTITDEKIVLQPGKGFTDQLMLLNFTQLPVNSSSKVIVDGVQLNTSALPAVFLQSHSSPSITVTVDMHETEPITVHYLLVNRHCSENAVLKMGDQARPILYLNETERLKLVSTPVHCAMLFTTDVGNQFEVHFPSPAGVADSADSLYFYNKKGQVVLKRNNFEGVIGTDSNMKIKILKKTDSLVIIYESPYVIAPLAEFQAPQIMAFPVQG